MREGLFINDMWVWDGVCTQAYFTILPGVTLQPSQRTSPTNQ